MKANKNIEKDNNDHFISLADMMSVLMVMFMLVAVVSMRSVMNKNEMAKQVAVAYKTMQENLYSDMQKEFKNNLTAWNAEINKTTLSITFNSPDILFDSGEATLKDNFKAILDDFFPRYISVMTNKYSEDIEEIRIEGYTDSDGNGYSREKNYFYNMKLSQDRTRNVLEYCMGLKYSQDKFRWLTAKITANGLSSSKLKYGKNGKEDKERSRRVEFRVKTKADIRIKSIIETLSQ